MANGISQLASGTQFAQAYDYKFHTAQYESVFSMVEVYDRGQIVIPKYIREMLKLTPGTNLSITVDEGKIILEKYDPVEELDKFRKDNAVYTTKELNRIMKDLEKKRHDELMKDVY
jgi:AbrB family looped-hinge helix DNA binding protein